MADNTVVHIGENSPEEVAHKLFRTIASNEGKTIGHGPQGVATADRKWVLSTYAECLTVVRNAHYAAK